MYGGSSSYASNDYKDLYDYLLGYNVNAGRIPDTLYYGGYDWNEYINMLVNYTCDDRVSGINLYITWDHVTYTYKKYSYSSPTTYTDLMVINEFDRKTSESYRGSDLDKYGLRTILVKLANYSIEHNINLFEKLYIENPQNDEPNNDSAYVQAILSYNAFRNSVNYALNNVDWTGYEEYRSSLESMPFIITCEPIDKLYTTENLVKTTGNVHRAYYEADTYNENEVDITINYTAITGYCPMFNFFVASSSQSAYDRIYNMLADNDSSSHIWWYGCCQPTNPYPNYNVNSNHVISRASRWLQFRLGVEGELYYSVCEWRNNIYDENRKEFTKEGQDAWLDEDDVWLGLSKTADAYGDGVLVYPNVTRYASYNNATGDNFKFVATYRLYVIRESIDDYNYLYYAQNLINNMDAGVEKTTAQNTLDSIIDSLYGATNYVSTITKDSSTLRSAREDLASLIESLN